MGMDAETVSPAFNASYTVEAPKMIPKILPVIMAFTVNSFTFASGETKGLNVFLSSDIVGGLKVRRYNNAGMKNYLIFPISLKTQNTTYA